MLHQRKGSGMVRVRVGVRVGVGVGVGVGVRLSLGSRLGFGLRYGCVLAAPLRVAPPESTAHDAAHELVQ